jgi:hypothetical protein
MATVGDLFRKAARDDVIAVIERNGACFSSSRGGPADQEVAAR